MRYICVAEGRALRADRRCVRWSGGKIIYYRRFRKLTPQWQMAGHYFYVMSGVQSVIRRASTTVPAVLVNNPIIYISVYVSGPACVIFEAVPRRDHNERQLHASSAARPL